MRAAASASEAGAAPAPRGRDRARPRTSRRRRPQARRRRDRAAADRADSLLQRPGERASRAGTRPRRGHPNRPGACAASPPGQLSARARPRPSDGPALRVGVLARERGERAHRCAPRGVVARGLRRRPLGPQLDDLVHRRRGARVRPRGRAASTIAATIRRRDGSTVDDTSHAARRDLDAGAAPPSRRASRCSSRSPASRVEAAGRGAAGSRCRPRRPRRCGCRGRRSPTRACQVERLERVRARARRRRRAASTAPDSAATSRRHASAARGRASRHPSPRGLIGDAGRPRRGVARGASSGLAELALRADASVSRVRRASGSRRDRHAPTLDVAAAPPSRRSARLGTKRAETDGCAGTRLGVAECDA